MLHKKILCEKKLKVIYYNYNLWHVSPHIYKGGGLVQLHGTSGK